MYFTILMWIVLCLFHKSLHNIKMINRGKCTMSVLESVRFVVNLKSRSLWILELKLLYSTMATVVWKWISRRKTNEQKQIVPIYCTRLFRINYFRIKWDVDYLLSSFHLYYYTFTLSTDFMQDYIFFYIYFQRLIHVLCFYHFIRHLFFLLLISLGGGSCSCRSF